MLIARIEPENNVETILDGVAASSSTGPFLVVGNVGNDFGKYLVRKFSAETRIRFIGPNYDIDLLNNLRFYSNIYFHGHSVGGTNPSLLEAMASGCLICAHKNEFNQSILNEEALYFLDKTDVMDVLNTNISKVSYEAYIQANLKKVETLYLWPKIIKDYENLFIHASR
jgi:glycosyltransferase involved in cell wall biosynthesis